MNWDNENDPMNPFGSSKSSIFAINGNLDGEDEDIEFVEREQFIGLVIGQEEFLLPISAVYEINMLLPITYVPNGSVYVDGVINLRGKILPAINMRKMMGIPRGKPTNAARIIIVSFEEISFGLLVDGITYVVSILPTEIEHQTLPGKGTGAEFIGSISKNGSKVRGILDLQRIMRTAGGTALEVADEDDDAA